MTRNEESCGGRLVKAIDRVFVGTSWEPEQWADGPWTWYLDGKEVPPVEAEAFRIMWEAEKVGGAK